MADSFLLPESVKDFIFDLHDSCRRSQNLNEQKSLYTQTLKDITSKYFSSSPFPPPEAIKNECESDGLFLAFYDELATRHLFTSMRPGLAEKLESWKVYLRLFDRVLEASADAIDMVILPEWIFEIMHEFVYQFQGFCQHRTQVKSRTTSDIETLKANPASWAVETVMFYLHNLIRVGSVKNAGQVQATFGHFASASLSRLECLLGDYHSCLSALAPFDLFDRSEIFYEVFSARLNVFYHAGISYFALRRYGDCVSVFQVMCSDINRGMKTGVLKHLAGYDQFGKLHEKMLALIAIVTNIFPSIKIPDSLSKVIGDKYSDKLAKINSGEDGYEDLFTFACPKFISPVLPDYANTSTNLSVEAYRHQVATFMGDISQQVQLPKMRSYLKLYSSIGIKKLAAFNDVGENEFLSRLICFKHKSFQVVMNPNTKNPLEGDRTNVADIFYYIDKEMVVVDEMNRQQQFEKFFVNQIVHCEDIRADLEMVQVPGQ